MFKKEIGKKLKNLKNHTKNNFFLMLFLEYLSIILLCNYYIFCFFFRDQTFWRTSGLIRDETNPFFLFRLLFILWLLPTAATMYA